MNPGPAITPGDPQASYLLSRIRAGEMPPGEGKVSAKEIETITRWIADGAKTARAEPASLAAGIGISDEERSWWAFQPIKRPAVPPMANERLRTPIDALLLGAMPAGLGFSPDAEKGVLIRRAYFDLLGLPPAPEELETWLTDQSADWYERLVEQLLASPHYGERWARHWLDAAGYADSEGATPQDAQSRWAYKYRDYVIRALNADKPLDRFLAEQLAGDELAGPITGDMTAEQIELLTATGYLRMAADGTGTGDNSPEARNQVVADTLKIVTSSLLGVSVACASATITGTTRCRKRITMRCGRYSSRRSTGRRGRCRRSGTFRCTRPRTGNGRPTSKPKRKKLPPSAPPKANRLHGRSARQGTNKIRRAAARRTARPPTRRRPTSAATRRSNCSRSIPASISRRACCINTTRRRPTS